MAYSDVSVTTKRSLIDVDQQPSTSAEALRQGMLLSFLFNKMII